MTLGVGDTVHVKVVEAAQRGGEPVIEFEVLDEGPHLGEHLVGRPRYRVRDWARTLLDGSPHSEGAPLSSLRRRTCRAVIGVSGRLRPQCIVEDVLPS